MHRLLAVLFATLVSTTPIDARESVEFVPSPLDPGVFATRSKPEQIARDGAGLAPKSSSAVDAIPGFQDPGPIVAVGTTLYVGNDPGGSSMSVGVLDASIYGAETLTQTFTTPVHPIDLAVVGPEIYVIDQNRNPVWHRPLSGSTWSAIALPSAISEWTYGNILFPHPTQPLLFVTQFWENRIQVVDLTTNTLVTTITDLHHLPTSIVFSKDGSRMAVLCTGLSAPSCQASGPNLAVFDTTSLAKIYEVNLQGVCSRALATDGATAYVVRDDGVLRIDLANGAIVGQIAVANLGRHATFNAGQLLAQDFSGNAIAIDRSLTAIQATYPLLQGPQIWFPPIEEMAALPLPDGRWFITNRNDDSVSVVRDSPECGPYGLGCAGSQGFVPRLSAEGCPFQGGSYRIALTQGLGGATCMLFAGTGTATPPLGGGCTFLVSPVLPPVLSTSLAGSGPGNGTLSFSVTVPATLPSGLLVTMQAFVIDPGALNGYSASNGHRARVH